MRWRESVGHASMVECKAELMEVEKEDVMKFFPLGEEERFVRPIREIPKVKYVLLTCEICTAILFSVYSD